MITVEEALSRVLALVRPVSSEEVPLAEAAGRVLAEPATARRSQPPFAASAMDGYAVRGEEVRAGAQFRIVGEAAAGCGFAGRVGRGEAVRIFTGAPVPEGADHVVIQEDVAREGDHLTLLDTLGPGPNVRPAGADFAAGARLPAPRRLRPADLALLAAMNLPRVAVARRPVVAIIATGNELVMPGEDPGPDQIVASNGFALKAMAEAEGAEARLLPIARDNEASLRTVFAMAEDADMILTIGGASVGDHDIVGPVSQALGMEPAFYKIAMRPGKPLMAGRLGEAVMLGLPGNPVSAIVCAHLFALPALRAMQGLPGEAPRRLRARLGSDVPQNGPREHYMRAWLEPSADGLTILPFESQDSSLLSILMAAEALLIRPVGDRARTRGETVEYIAI